MRVLVALALCACLLAVPACSAGALNMAISTATVRDFVAKFVPQVEAGLQGLAISDVEVDKDGFDVKLTSLSVKSLTTSSVDITTGSNKVIVALRGIRVSLHGHYKVQEDAIGHVTICSGDFDVSANANSLSVSISVGDSGGIPVVSAGDASFDLGDFDVHFCTAVGWIVDLFKGTIKDKVEDAVKGQMASQIDSIAKKEIATLPFVVSLTPDLGVDYHLASGVDFSSTQGSVSVLGAIFDPKTKQQSPFPPSPMPVPTLSESLTVDVCESIPQGAAWSYFVNGALNYKLQGKSGLLKDFIVSANITSVPSFNISSAGAAIDVAASLEVEFTPFPDYGFGVDLKVLLDAELLAMSNGTGTYLYAQIPEVDLEDLKIDFILKNHSNLPFDEKALLPFLNTVLSEGLKLANPALQKLLFPLPTIKYLQVVDTKLQYMDGYVSVSTNLKPATFRAKLSGRSMERRLGRKMPTISLRDNNAVKVNE